MELLVTVKSPKFVSGDDQNWQKEGYDACRTTSTSASTQMEWCVKSPAQIKVVRVTPLRCEVAENDEMVALIQHVKTLQEEIASKQAQVRQFSHCVSNAGLFNHLHECVLG